MDIQDLVGETISDVTVEECRSGCVIVSITAGPKQLVAAFNDDNKSILLFEGDQSIEIDTKAPQDG
ncbi:MAG: hypothetical protein V3U84_02210 [Thiotrichaceae bacterium]